MSSLAVDSVVSPNTALATEVPKRDNTEQIVASNKNEEPGIWQRRSAGDHPNQVELDARRRAREAEKLQQEAYELLAEERGTTVHSVRANIYSQTHNQGVWQRRGRGSREQ